VTPAESLTARLGGRWHGRYGTAKCLAHDDHTPSLSLRDGEREPLLTCHAGCDRRDIIEELRRRGLWRVDRRNEPRKLRRAEGETRNYILEIWRSCRTIADTPAERYLRSRVITIEIPPTLRFHPGLKHSNTGLLLPCMVAAVQGPDRSIVAIHRTFLRADGTGKAQVSSPRKMLGSVRGCAVRLAAAAPELAIGEGIETSLSFQQITGTPTWAALSATALGAVELPPLPSAATVFLLIDRDSAGEAAADVAANRFTREGRTVKLVRPMIGKDINDAIRGTAHA
jgi:putative DNA primase/helicase